MPRKKIGKNDLPSQPKEGIFMSKGFLRQAGVSVIPAETIEKKIYLIRGQRVMLDKDLAELYGLETRVLNQTVRRNLDRFPEDFM